MGQRSAQQGRAAAGGSQAGDHLYSGLCAFSPQFIDQRGHTVDAAVAGAYHGHLFAFPGGIQCHAAAVHLPGHGGAPKLLSGIAFLHQVHIDRIADDGIAFPQHAVRADRHIVIITGADAHNTQLTQNVPPNLSWRRPRSRPHGPSFLPAVFPRPPWRPARRHCPLR